MISGNDENKKCLNVFKNLWKNSFNYKGIAGRKEFFLSAFINCIGMYVFFIPFLAVCAGVFWFCKSKGIIVSQYAASVIGILYSMIFVFPLISLTFRRANDAKLKLWQCIALLILNPVIGFLLIGFIKLNPEIKSCLLTKIGRYLFAVGILGGSCWGLWSYMLFKTDIIMMIALSLGVIGILIGYIGTKIDESRGYIILRKE